MATTDFLLVRIVPTSPCGPTAFGEALNALTITAFDKTVADPTNDRQLGTASGLADQPTPGQTGPSPAPLLPVLNISGNPPTLQPSIFQHYGVDGNIVTMYSVATAIIIIDRQALANPNEEYPTPSSYDVTIKLAQASAQQSVVSRQQILDFNVNIVTTILVPETAFYMAMATDIYLSIDVPAAPLPAGTNVVTLSADGTPPSFQFMVTAINNVLADDAPAGASSLQTMTTFLTTAQAQQVAGELVNDRLIDPAPQPPYPTSDIFNSGTIFEDMYTIPDSGGTVKQDIDQARTKFEGDRASYYALRTSNALQVANYVYSTIFAVYAETYTTTAALAVVEVPIMSVIQHSASESTPSLPLSGTTGGAALSPPFIIPAAYFYALSTTYSISQTFDTRLKLLFTTPEATLVSSLQLAIGSGVLGSPDPTTKLISYACTLTSNGGASINQLQAIRRMTALQASVQNPPSAVVDMTANTSVQVLITSWLEFEGADADLANQIWFPPATEYLNAILEIIAPGDEPLISEILVDLRLPPTSGTGLGPVITNVTDLLNVGETQWYEFFTRHTGLLPSKYLLGDLKARVRSFVQDITKVLFVLPAQQAAAAASTQPAIPNLGANLSTDILVQFFNASTFTLSDQLNDTELGQIHAAALQLFGSNSIAKFVTSAVKELWVVYQVTNLPGTCKSPIAAFPSNAMV